MIRRTKEADRRRSQFLCDTAMQMVNKCEATSLADAARKLAEHSGETFFAVYNTIKRKARKEKKAAEKTRVTISNGVVVVEKKDRKARIYNEAQVFMCFAMEAISQLERINPKDPNRKAAIKRIGAWVIENL